MNENTAQIDLVDIDDLHTWLHDEGLEDFINTIAEFLKTKPVIASPDNAGADYPPYQRLNLLREKYSIYTAVQRTYEDLIRRE